MTLICLGSSTTISGVWIDDFKSDTTEANGWNIYNEYLGALDNPIIQGFGSRQYHGAFTDSKNKSPNWMKRQFQCLSNSNLFISFKYAYCRTEKADTFQFLYSGQTKTITKDYSMASSPGTNLKNIGGSSSVFNANAQHLDRRCDDRNERWKYQSVSDLNLGAVDANTLWLISFKSIFSASNEYALIFDISINCDSLIPPTTTSKPTMSPLPTFAPTTPTLSPSLNPTNAPSLPPIPVGYQRGAHGQFCPIIGQGLSVNNKCLAVTDVVSSDSMGFTECLERNDCCMCGKIECGVSGNVKCDTVRIGHYAAYGVRDFKVIGNDGLDGAVIECLGM